MEVRLALPMGPTPSLVSLVQKASCIWLMEISISFSEESARGAQFLIVTETAC